ncbi:MAG: YkgJ family cysteine cluster protein [Propionivibrio sp.]
MDTLTQLHSTIDARVQSIRDSVADWPCAKGCDGCCHRLAEIPTLTEAEWELLREGLTTLSPDQFGRIRMEMAALGNQASGPFVCPFLDRASGACPVYAQRPVACRTYGFYVQRNRGLYCREIEIREAEGALAEVMWGNHDAIDACLSGLGEARSLTEWFNDWETGKRKKKKTG